MDWVNITNTVIATVIAGLILAVIRFFPKIAEKRKSTLKERHRILKISFKRLLKNLKTLGANYIKAVEEISKRPAYITTDFVRLLNTELVGRFHEIKIAKMDICEFLNNHFLSGCEKSKLKDFNQKLSQLLSTLEDFNKSWNIRPQRISNILPSDNKEWERFLKGLSPVKTLATEIERDAAKVIGQIDQSLQNERWWKFWQRFPV